MYEEPITDALTLSATDHTRQERIGHTWALIIKTGIAASLLCVALLTFFSHSRPLQADAQDNLASAPTHPFSEPDAVYFPLHTVPLSDGQSAQVFVDGIDEPHRILFADLEIGPGHVKHSHSYVSETQQSHVATIFGFTEYESVTATLTITLATGLLPDNTRVLHLALDRLLVPLWTTPDPAVDLDDHLADLDLRVQRNTFTKTAYIMVVKSPPQGAPAPPGHALVGETYDIRLQDGSLDIAQPMTLSLHAPTGWRTDHAPQTLRVGAWQRSAQQWRMLSSTLSQHQGLKAAASIQESTVYALMTTPVWHDGFTDYTGLTHRQAVRLQYIDERPVLALSESNSQGHILSVPITLPAPNLGWQTLQFIGAENPGTSLTVDLLDQDGSLVLGDLDAETDLTAYDLRCHPSLRLRATFHTTNPSQSPTLKEWSISWDQVPAASSPPRCQSLRLPILAGRRQ